MIRFGISRDIRASARQLRWPVREGQGRRCMARGANPRLAVGDLCTAAGFAGVLQAAREALRAGELRRAEAALMWASSIAGDDPAFLTLVGVLHECQGRNRAARKSYGRAIALHGNCGAAQQNMRRLYELATFGRATEPIALGDEPTDNH